jgi:glycosyltransferase involved in cell wall biosynthesis
LRVRMLGRGDPNVAMELRRRASTAGYAELLELPGFVASDALPQEFSRADIFAAPSRYEGGPGFVYLEAMACGVPVIACEGSGAAEVVTPRQTGFLVPPDDPGRLADVLRQLLADRSLREAMGRCAREFVRREADSAACIRRIETFYQSVVTPKQPC